MRMQPPQRHLFRAWQIRDLAPDVVECCSLARKLGLLLTDRLTDDAVATTDEADGLHEHVAASMNGGGGEYLIFKIAGLCISSVAG